MRSLLGWFFSRTPRIKICLVAALVLAVALGAFHRPLLGGVRGWRAERLVAEAQRHAEKENWDEVQRTATASLQLRASIGAIRLLLWAHEKTGSPQILLVAVSLFTHPEASTADRARTLRLCLNHNDILGVARLAQHVSAEDREDPDMRYQLVRFLVKARSYREAIAIVDGLPGEERTPALELLVARGVARSEDKEARAANAVRLARVLGGMDREAALGAMRLLASLPDEQMVENSSLAQTALERFASENSLAVFDRLRLDLLHVVLEPESREALIATRVDSYQEEHLEDLIPWLRRLEQPLLVAELTSPERHSEPLISSLFLNRAWAMEVLERLDELEDELEAHPPAVEDVPLLCIRAALATKLGESRGVLLWREAMNRAERDSSRNWYYHISRLAGRFGNKGIEMESLARGIENHLGLPPRAEQLPELFAWLYQRGETERLLSISRRLLRRESGNPLLINNYHYLKILHAQTTAEDVEILRNLVAAFPREPAFVGTLALALLKHQRPQEALSVLDALETEERPRSEMALRAAALAALDHPEESAALSAKIDWEQFSSEEKRVLKELALR